MWFIRRNNDDVWERKCVVFDELKWIITVIICRCDCWNWAIFKSVEERSHPPTNFFMFYFKWRKSKESHMVIICERYTQHIEYQFSNYVSLFQLFSESKKVLSCMWNTESVVTVPHQQFYNTKCWSSKQKSMEKHTIHHVPHSFHQPNEIHECEKFIHANFLHSMIKKAQTWKRRPFTVPSKEFI